jgi:acyl-CoA thioester hydrolase
MPMTAGQEKPKAPKSASAADDSLIADSLVELGVSSVESWECDAMGHMNVQFYVARAEEGLLALLARLGYGPSRQRQQPIAVASGSLHIRFHRELRPAAAYRVFGGIVKPADREPGQASTRRFDATGTLTCYQEIRKRADQSVAATFVHECTLIDRDSGQPAPPQLTSGLLLHPSLRLDAIPEIGRPRGIEPSELFEQPTVADAERFGLATIYRAPVRAGDCDAAGLVTPTAFMSYISAGIPSLVYDLRGRDRSSAGSHGGAALEYRFQFRRPARQGDLVRVMSGLRGVGSKTQNFCHWILDDESGEAFATAEAVAVAMDLTARKAVAFSDEERAQLEDKIVPGLAM